MSIATPPPAGISPAPPFPPPPSSPGEACPLCGAPLHPEQEWCVRCGAAARTRLAASPNWKKPIAALAIVVALSLGVIAAALVALVGSSTTSTVKVTSTVASPVAGVAPTQTSTVPSTTLPSATTPQTGTPTTGAAGANAFGSGAAAAARPQTTAPTGGTLLKRLTKIPSSPSPHVKLSPKAKAEIRRALAKTAP